MLEKLESIDQRLALLTVAEERNLRREVEDRLLRTEKRVLMFDSIDGERSSADIATNSGVSGRAAQAFVKELLDLGLVRVVREVGARGFIVAHDRAALVRWYLRGGDIDGS
jgi:predicted transcriptional regulator